MPSRFVARRNELMPSPAELVARAQERVQASVLPNQLDAEYVRESIDDLVLNLLDTEYELFKEAERAAGTVMLSEFLIERAPSDASPKLSIPTLVDRHFNDLDEFFLGQSQSRRSRAGNSFERHLAFLFEHLGLPFEEQQVINGTPDFLMPNAELYRTNPGDVILVTVKRTLRERWRQVIVEGERISTYFLATIDERITQATLDEMAQNRIVVVIPAAIVAKTPRYIDARNVVSFAEFLTLYVEPTSKRW